MRIALAALLTTIASLNACTPTITCEQTGCPFGQVCSSASGRCERPETDCRNDASICRADERCDERSGSCRSLQVSCVGDTLRCPTGQECNTARGVCQPVTQCLSERDCTGRDICDALTRRCVPPPCEAPADCQPGTVCDAGACIPGCQPPDSPCPTGQLCRLATNATLGQCLSECGQDTDCPFGRFCDFARRPPTCELEPPCILDAECRPDEVCRESQCTRAPCMGDADCPALQRCDAITGDCDVCADDTLSPNHTPSAATSLTDGRFTDLKHCPGRPDWFALELASGEELRASLTPRDPAAQLELLVLDADLRRVASDQQRGATARVIYQATRAGRFFLKINGNLRDASRYDLEITRRLQGVCRDDRFEENDSPAQATSLRINPGEGVQLALTLCPADEDWFALRDLNAESGLQIATINGSSAQPRLELWTPDGRRYDPPEEGPLRLLRLNHSGDYLVRIYSPRRLSGDYTASFNVTPPYACPSQGRDNTVEAALPIEPNAQFVQELCPAPDGWEVDWLRLATPEADAELSVKLAAGPHTPPLRLELFELVPASPSEPDEDEMTPPMSVPTIRLLRVGAPDGPRGHALSLPVRADQILLLKLSSQAPPARLFGEPTYQLFYQLNEHEQRGD